MVSSSPTSHNSLGFRIAQISKNQPDNIAIIHDGFSISYRDLYSRVQSLSSHLRAEGIEPDSIVGISTHHGSDHIIAQLAVIHAGATCLPFDGALEVQEIQRRLQAVNAKCIIIDDNGKQDQFKDMITIALRSIQQAQDASPPYSTGPDFQSHILFSSGTTGLPKAIQIPGCGISNLANDQVWRPAGKSGRFGHINSTGFDASLIDIWVALLLGATIVVLDRKKLLNPVEFAEQLKHENVTVLVLTASVFKKISSFRCDAFCKVELLLVGGDLPDTAACKTVLRQEHRPKLINVYGPTECSVLAFVHEVQMDDLDRGRMPLGRPVFGINYFIIDEKNQIINTNSNIIDNESNLITTKSGELCLGGTSLSRGYVTKDSSTTNSGKFFNITDPKNPNKSIRVHRTGDIIKIHNDFITWWGRKSLEFKFDGHRIQPAEIEKALRKTRLVDDVLTMKLANPSTNIEYLISCVVYGKFLGSFESLWAEMKKWQARHTVTQVIEFDSFPQNSNGKNDRDATIEQLKKKLTTRHESIRNAHLNNSKTDDPETWNIKEKLTRIWARSVDN